MSKVILEVRKLEKTYHDGERELHVLRGVDLSVCEGEVVAITGQSGSGKSTLLNLLGALDRPTAGNVLLDGRNLANLSGQKLNLIRRDEIGFIFQFHHLIPELRAWENVAMPGLIRQVPASEAREKAFDLMGRVGLEDRVNHIPTKLSGGEQQRVALARALMNNPRLILADEPTGNLDAQMGRQVIDLLWEMTKKQGRTLVIVTHEKEIADRADRELVLKNGVLQDL
ncbi:ABC transporter ATP-binding protein [bacterium]|nr:ABC transporter ATP-binding protein [bacterium]